MMQLNPNTILHHIRIVCKYNFVKLFPSEPTIRMQTIDINNIREESKEVQRILIEALKKQDAFVEKLNTGSCSQSMPPPIARASSSSQRDLRAGAAVKAEASPAPPKKQVKRLNNQAQRRNAAVSTVSIKCRNFIDEPIGDKGIETVPGIGPAALKAFQKYGITKAMQLFGEYLKMNRNDDEFSNWLKKEIGIKPKFAQEIISGINLNAEIYF